MRSVAAIALTVGVLVSPSYAADCAGNGTVYADPWDPGASAAWTWPCSNAAKLVTGTYLEDRSVVGPGTSDLHLGTDVAGLTGDHVVAVESGTVRDAWHGDAGELENWVIIENDNGAWTLLRSYQAQLDSPGHCDRPIR